MPRKLNKLSIHGRESNHSVQFAPQDGAEQTSNLQKIGEEVPERKQPKRLTFDSTTNFTRY